jgi:hypothetical protein
MQSIIRFQDMPFNILWLPFWLWCLLDNIVMKWPAKAHLGLYAAGDGILDDPLRSTDAAILV